MQSFRSLRRAISKYPIPSPQNVVSSSSIIPVIHRFCPLSRSFTGTPIRRSKTTHNVRSSDKSHKKSAGDISCAVTEVMAKLPHPAVVITTLDRTYQAQANAGIPIAEMRHPVARGVTVSSFTSLCVRPRPHVMFNMTLPSTMYEALVSCGDFNVHVLAPDEHGARVAGVFTRGNRNRHGGEEDLAFDVDADLGVFVGLREHGMDTDVVVANRKMWHEQYREARESGLRILESESASESETEQAVGRVGQVHHVPYLHFKGVMEVLNCRLVRVIHPDLPGAGHNIIVIGEVVDVISPKESDDMPVALGYADRRYRAIAEVIHPYNKG